MTAPTTAELRALTRDCVHCGFCLPTCPTYTLWHEEMDSPRGRIQLLEKTLDGSLTLSATVIKHFDRCLGCVACVSSCPSGVRYGELIEGARALVESEHRRPLGERLQRRLLFATLPYPARMRWALRLAPLGRALPTPRWARSMLDVAIDWRSTSQAPPRTAGERGAPNGRVGLLAGCVQRVMFGDVNAATARVLAAAGYDVLVPAQGCCGALSAHAGRLSEAESFTDALFAAFAGLDAIVVNASGCGSHLKERAPKHLRVLDVTEALREATLAPLHPLPLVAAYQDSCHMRHAQRLPGAWRPLLERIPELTVVEPGEQDICCGSAGTFNVTQPDAARELGDRKATHVRATGAQVLASANPGCLVQVAQALRRSGQPLAALHPVELLDASLRGVQSTTVLGETRR